MTLTKKQIQDYFISIDLYLLDKNNIHTSANLKKVLTPQTGPGVYYVFNKGKLCYVGESGSLHGRMKDFHRTLNHTFRRSLGTMLFDKHKYYSIATSKKKFHDEIEKELDAYVNKNVKISFRPLDIGRKEFEDWTPSRHPKIKFLNKRGQRSYSH